jgi:thioesterase domain-containing protein
MNGDMKDKSKFLQNYFYKKIPITKKLKMKVLNYEKDSLIISAPIKENHNDKGTAFAGSIYSVATLAGWGFVSLKMLDEKLDAKVAIYNGNITYKKPINKDFTAVCSIIDQNDWNKFVERVKNKSNGKVQLKIEISNTDKTDNEPESILYAEYYAWLNKEYLP